MTCKDVQSGREVVEEGGRLGEDILKVGSFGGTECG
jgi:hypothetical protein